MTESKGSSPVPPREAIAEAMRARPGLERPGDKTPGEIADLVLHALTEAGYTLTSTPRPVMVGCHRNCQGTWPAGHLYHVRNCPNDPQDKASFTTGSQ